MIHRLKIFSSPLATADSENCCTFQTLVSIDGHWLGGVVAAPRRRAGRAVCSNRGSTAASCCRLHCRFLLPLPTATSHRRFLLPLLTATSCCRLHCRLHCHYHCHLPLPLLLAAHRRSLLCRISGPGAAWGSAPTAVRRFLVRCRFRCHFQSATAGSC